MVAIANYFASVSVKPDERGLKAVDNYLKAIENKLRKGTNGNGTGKGLVLNVSINQRFLRKSIADTIEKGVFRAKITPVLNKGSLQAIKQQIQSVFATPINIKVNPTATRSPRAVAGTRTGTAYSWSPNPSGRGGATPHLTEWLAGRPDKSSLSAANRRYSDSIMNRGFFGPGGAPNTLRGFMGETVLGGLGRAGSSTLAGRGLSSLGGALGSARLGAVGLMGGALVKGATSLVTGIWSSLGKMVTTPFSLIGGAANAVTSGFYRLALAAAPLVASFMYINKRVQDASSKDIAINATASRMGTTGAAEKEWLYNMAQTEGMRYRDMIVPYSSFLNAYAPKKGVEASRDMFQSFSQYGRVFGATTESSGRAFYGLSQMVGKDQVMAQELNEQIAEAQGFAGFKQLMAEAYQISLGRTKEEAKKDRDAIAKMGKAMEGGKVKPGDVFPILAELLKEASSIGVEQARKSPTAAEDRFWNEMDKGWEKFTKGGGASGIQAFWDDLTSSIGEWWLDNAADLGKKFEGIVKGFKVLRSGITEFFQFMKTGENNSFSNWAAQEQGVDIVAIRRFFIDLWEGIQGITKDIAKSIGLLNSEGNLDMAEFTKRIRTFGGHVIDAVSSMMKMFAAIAKAISINMEILQGGWGNAMNAVLNPFSDAYKQRQESMGLVWSALSHGIDATASAAKGVTSPFTPSQGFYATSAPFVPGDYSLVSPSNTFVGSRLSGSSGFSGKPIRPDLYRPDQALTPQGSGLDRQVLDVNVNLTVNGDPESVKLFVTEEVTRGIAERVPTMIDYGFNGKLKSALVGAPGL